MKDRRLNGDTWLRFVHKRLAFDRCVMINMILHRITALIGVISSKEQYVFTIGVSNITIGNFTIQ